MIPRPLPRRSEEFLPPTSNRLVRKDEAGLKAENPDRERLVCAIGIDVHYELNVVSNETGAYEPRLKPFNPRMSGPAMPYPYSGKLLEEEEYRRLMKDPVALGRAIEQQDPYDPLLYCLLYTSDAADD